MTSTVARRLLPLVLLALPLTVSCSGENPYQAAQSETSSPGSTGPDTTVNDLLPARENVTDCIGAVERPDCGSKAKGDWRMYLTFAILIAGISFIGWRVVRGVRARDSVVIE